MIVSLFCGDATVLESASGFLPETEGINRMVFQRKMGN